MEPLATQEAHPNKASVRTFVQTVVAAAVIIIPIVPVVVNIILDEFGKAGVEAPGWLFAALSGIAVAAGLIAAIVARIMAIPGVNDLLAKIGLSPKPKAKLTYAEGGYTGPIDRDLREMDDTPPDDDYKPKH